MNLSRRRLLLSVGTVALASAVRAAPTSPVRVSDLPTGDPRRLGLLPERLMVADTLVAEYVARGGVPGAVLLVAHRGSIALRRAYGSAGLRPQTRPMRLDTIFDLASLTKVFATATSALKLLEDGKIDMETLVAHYLPAFAVAGGDKARITIRHLFTHAAGFPAGIATGGRTLSLAELLPEIAARKQVGPPGEQFLYSDLSFITLGAVIEAVSGQSLRDFAYANIYGPLQMTDTGFLPDA